MAYTYKCTRADCDSKPAALVAITALPCSCDSSHRYIARCAAHKTAVSSHGQVCADCKGALTVGPWLTPYFAARTEFLAAGDDKYAASALESMLDQVTLDSPDLDQVAAEKWPKTKALRPYPYVRLKMRTLLGLFSAVLILGLAAGMSVRVLW